jgi:2-keto-4-pentenoate hydratase/2-oxohepta-3-ene-1,7-dioic acid hydratase in catechol pathway
MRFVTYVSTGRPTVGLLDAQDRVHDVAALLGTQGAELDLVGLIESWSQVQTRLSDVRAGGVPVTEVQLLAPFPRPRRNIFCVGKNYREHAREFGTSGYDASSGPATDDHIPQFPVVFTKAPTSVIGPEAAIDPHSTVTKELDYEAELAVVIGAGGTDIPASRALEHVWGYTIVNDVTARDRQRDHKQWFLGKSLDGFCPMGPYALTADEVDEDGLTVECRVNGELRQRASTADLIFDIPTLIETISAGLTLEPGDIIATGTPAGVGIGFEPPRFLRSGDLVEVSITGLGTLRNRVA